MTTYSTCSDCKLLLEVVDEHTAHPNCTEPTPRDAELVTLFRAALERDDDDEIRSLGAILDRRPAAPRLLDAALIYAGWGWPVFPLTAGRKTPATRNGFKDASTDPAVIRRWWKALPQANIGLPTGHGFDVVDVDAPAGWPAYAELVDTDTLPEVHGVVSTAGAGLHLYVRPTGGGNLAGLRPGVDYRGVGGYVVAPPSIDQRGHPYTWRVKPSPLITGRTTDS